MRKVIFAAIVAAVLLLIPSRAAADPAPVPTIPTRLNSAAVCETAGGTRLELPPGFWLYPAAQHERLDGELRGYQESDVRLKAENESLKASARNSGRPPWYYIGGALLLGFTGGYAWKKIEEWRQ